VIFYISYIFLSLVTGSIFLFNCFSQLFTSLTYIQFGIIDLILIFILIILVFIDILLNIKKLCSKKFFEVFTKDDPFYFRSELILFFIFCYCFLAQFVIDLLLQIYSQPYPKLFTAIVLLLII
jgi:hypothetical protein